MRLTIVMSCQAGRQTDGLTVRQTDRRTDNVKKFAYGTNCCAAYWNVQDTQIHTHTNIHSCTAATVTLISWQKRVFGIVSTQFVHSFRQRTNNPTTVQTLYNVKKRRKTEICILKIYHTHSCVSVSAVCVYLCK